MSPKPIRYRRFSIWTSALALALAIAGMLVAALGFTGLHGRHVPGTLHLGTAIFAAAVLLMFLHQRTEIDLRQGRLWVGWYWFRFWGGRVITADKLARLEIVPSEPDATGYVSHRLVIVDLQGARRELETWSTAQEARQQATRLAEGLAIPIEEPDPAP